MCFPCSPNSSVAKQIMELCFEIALNHITLLKIHQLIPGFNPIPRAFRPGRRCCRRRSATDTGAERAGKDRISLPSPIRILGLCNSAPTELILRHVAKWNRECSLTGYRVDGMCKIKISLPVFGIVFQTVIRSTTPSTRQIIPSTFILPAHKSMPGQYFGYKYFLFLNFAYKHRSLCVWRKIILI